MDGVIDVVPTMTRHRITVYEYELMAQVGILRPDERVELIDGEIIDMAPIGQGHEATTNGLTRALVRACGDRGIVSVQNSVRLDAWSQPQPDFAVFRFRADFYAHGSRPGPEETLLLIEVSESSLRYDDTVKRPLYAKAHIPEFWIVNLAERRIEVYRRPDGEVYRDHATYLAGDTLALAADPEIVVSLDVMFAQPRTD